MSKSWKNCAADELKTTTKFDRLSSGQDFEKNFLDSKHVLKVCFKPSRKNQDFWFLPLPLQPVSLANGHLNDINFWKVSGNPKTSRFWKLQLSMSYGTQKSFAIKNLDEIWIKIGIKLEKTYYTKFIKILTRLIRWKPENFLIRSR